ncbi:MAG: prenyltransferase/squalene oxidase repeat-containing protein [Pirellulales bacterium]|nr:prenyltransferase/squalene oxidase repeat-containing protein [Pirellulales bacterium]
MSQATLHSVTATATAVSSDKPDESSPLEVGLDLVQLGASLAAKVPDVPRGESLGSFSTPAQNNPPPSPTAGSRWQRWVNDSTGQLLASGLSSAAVHMALLIALAMWWTIAQETPLPRTLDISIQSETEPLDTAKLSLTPTPEDDPTTADPLVGMELPGRQDLAGWETPLITRTDLYSLDQPPPTGDVTVKPPGAAATSGTGQESILGGLSGAGRAERRQRAREVGATAESESAVELALAWLANHQRPDGSWRFDHTDGACDGTCANPGTHASTTAATSLALLAFYGANYNHLDGKYAKVINNGLYYLGSRMLVTPHGGDLQEGTMYAQGMAAITLCEAYALTGDATLRGYAERAIQFVIYAQDRQGGGWRYTPGAPGDLTVTGWQLMALKSAQMAGLEVPSPVFHQVNKFLDSVQVDQGAGYGYKSPQRRDSTTAVGLLSRMYLGWKQDHPALVRGIAALEKTGPAPADMYYNYYATQVLMHHGGHAWQRWNPRMREYLLAQQVKTGHAAGSWYFPNQHGDEGGRLFNTVLATLTLEVYYRHQPLYQSAAVESGF